VHNWWHLALYHLEVGAVDEVLRLFDGPIFGKRSNVVLDMIDASAMLWRLRLRGLDVRSRFAELADLWAPIASAGNYAFNDMHAMMAFVGSGREQEQQAVLDAQRAAMQSDADNAAFTRDVGHAAALAMQAFGHGRYADCIDLLRPIRSTAARFGGSHAQRDLIDLTLIEAANRAGNPPLAAALTAERAALRPASPLTRLLVQRSAALRKAA